MFHIMQNKKLLDENTIIDILHKYNSIDKYAYILHDKDIYTKQDELNDINHKCGTLKPEHWHIVIKLKSNFMSIQTIARWFDIPFSCIKGLSGYNAFDDCITYILHKTNKAKLEQKHEYNQAELKSSPTLNFIYKNKLPSKSISRDYYRYKVLKEGMTIDEIIEENHSAYTNDSVILDKFRRFYLNKYMPVPDLRLNFYICGGGRSGKGTLSRIIANVLFPEKEKEDLLYCEITNDNVGFEDYDGQPVTIWDDCRAFDLLSGLNGRGKVFKIFDINPSRKTFHIKFGKIRLCNEVSIVNSIQHYKDFIDELAGDEDKRQVFGRFVFIIFINSQTNTFDLFVNKGFFLCEREDNDYYVLRDIPFDAEKIIKDHKQNPQQCRSNEIKQYSFIKEYYDMVVSNRNYKTTQEEIDNFILKFDGIVSL